VYALRFSPSGRWLATGSGDGWLHIYDVKVGNSPSHKLLHGRRILIFLPQAREMKWSWFAGFDQPGVFEIDWQSGGGLDRIALALECRNVAIIDISKIEALQK
jgi:transducin (beta)-like 1